MAKNKSASWFKLWLRHKPVIDGVSDADAGRALKAALQYFESGELPALEGVAAMAFALFQYDVDEAAEDYRGRSSRGAAAVAKRWQPESAVTPEADGVSPEAVGFESCAQTATEADRVQPGAAEADRVQPGAADADRVQPGAADADRAQAGDADADRVQPGAADADRVQAGDPPGSLNNIYTAVIGLLNREADSSFRADSKATRRLIGARLREGYTREELETVVRHQCRQWGRDPTMRKYLRPETLFGTKFEGYLNDAKRTSAPPGEEYVLAPLIDPYDRFLNMDYGSGNGPGPCP